MQDDNNRQQPIGSENFNMPITNSNAAQNSSSSPKKRDALLIIFAAIAVGIVGALLIISNNKDKQPTSTPVVTPADSSSVVISANGFNPTSIAVKKGTQVTWTNTDSKPHQVASDPHPTHTNFPALTDDEALNKDESYSFTFEKAGTYTYHDHLNPSKTGTVIVE